MLVCVPRINTNDDEVKLVEIDVELGQRVRKGQVLAHVETEKAVMEVEAPEDGFVLKVVGHVGEMLRVGSGLMWLGESADAVVPKSAELGIAGRGELSRLREPTAKAKALLAAHGVDPTVVPLRGERLRAEDVERYVAGHEIRRDSRADGSDGGGGETAHRDVPGRLVALSREERGMVATVSWHREVAVPGYIEISYDQQAWEGYANAFAHTPTLLGRRPILPLLAWRLVGLAKSMPRLNATIVGDARYEYSEVNFGFTVQIRDVLYLAVIRNAGALGPREFAEAMTKVLRKAARRALSPQETTGATIGFSSMARWRVNRHMPILSPWTAVMVSHTVDKNGIGVLGASYDHRVLNGYEIVSALRELSRPPAEE